MRFPEVADYQGALQNPSIHFFDTELKTARLEKRPTGLPKGYAGRTTITFHFFNGDREWAVRCFHRYIPDLRERYLAIGELLKQKELPFIVPTECLEEGFFLNGKKYPVIKMQWVNGQTLTEFLSENFRASDELRDLANQFRDIVRSLEKERIAHGDLQHGNIIIQKGKIVLIDYDGIFLPEISHLHSTDIGHSNYQHSKRDENHYHHLLDRFSAIVIYFGLIAVAENPRLFEEFHNKENIIFVKEDFEKPRKSKVFSELLNQESTKKMCGKFIAICEGKIEDIPSLYDFISQSAFYSSQNEANKKMVIDPRSHEVTQDRDFGKRVFSVDIKGHSKIISDDIVGEIVMYEKLLENNPNNIDYMTKLVVLYYNNDFYIEALELFKQIKEIDPNAYPFIDKMIGYCKNHIAGNEVKYYPSSHGRQK